MRVEIHESGAQRLPQLREEVWAVSDEVFGDQPDAATWRSQVWAPHSRREGFRLAVAGRRGQADAVGPAGLPTASPGARGSGGATGSPRCCRSTWPPRGSTATTSW